jgi:glycosyltransferase involved in cell wall biosynthesis
MRQAIEIRIVIPCYREPEILQTVRSVLACRRPACGVEIVVAVNSYGISTEAVKDFNRKTFNELQLFADTLSEEDIRLTPLLFEDLPGHQTGAGLPRKLGMDWAVAQFEAAGRMDGIVVSLDADCQVAENYLSVIYEQFREHRLRSATIEFHHPVEHLPEQDPIRRATEVYESYLRYYRSALQYTGYPYACYTIGSAFAVTAQTYRQAGGMGKQQAGEDFYFLQKVFPMGRTRFLDATCVYPAARVSDRVPFGTGPAVAQLVAEGRFAKKSYRVEAFEELRQLFGTVESLFKQPVEVIEAYLRLLPAPMQRFLSLAHFTKKIIEIGQHTRTAESFRKRFFDYFNGFKVLKYLNFVHPEPHAWADVETEGWPELRRRTIECSPNSGEFGGQAPLLEALPYQTTEDQR